MKKDEPQNDSVLTKIDESNKAAEKKEAELEVMRTRCKTCFKEIAPKRICGGHGGGGGGGGEGANEDDDASTKLDDDTLLMSDATTEPVDTLDFVEEVETSHAAEPEVDEDSFDAKIIADLIARGLLVVENDRDSMTLTIDLQCELNALSAEERQALKKFMSAILKELDAFKAENNISGDCVEIIQDEEENILNLSIYLPTLALYDAFIQRLSNNLLPASKSELQESDENSEEASSAPSPFSTNMKPY